MKAAVSLSELLNGNTKARRAEANTNEVQEPTYNEDETLESIDMSGEVGSSSPLKTSQPTPKEKGGPSVQSFLMSSRQKKGDTMLPKEFSEEPEIIALDDDFNDELHLGIESENNGSRLPTVSRVEPPSSFKKTTLKDLFNNFRPESEPLKLKASVVSSIALQEEKKKVKRGAISSSAPFPSRQMVEPFGAIAENRSLNLPMNKKKRCITELISFDPDDFKSLNDRESSQENTGRVKIASARKYSQLWTKLFKPRSVDDVMLEPSLKKNVAEWIETAFLKLRRPTKRTKMLKRQKIEYDPLDDFIIDESLDIENTTEEFVPIMIMHGDGIGKNTLLDVLMDHHEGQIYEVNTSNNRSKKDILDTLMDFSTTHYVKGQGSKGIILLDDVDVLFKEHDKFFWQTVEKILLTSRRPIVILCRDINFVPSNVIQLAIEEDSLFHCKRVSHQTVIAFLERYCRKIDLKIDRAILQLLVACSKRDIRKCLMDLQFCCTPPGDFKEPAASSQESVPYPDLKKTSQHLDLLSFGDILDRQTVWKSSISQDIDHTLMTPHAQAALNGMADDQERLQHDYMVDYRLHLVDKLNNLQLPYELNVGNYLEQQLSCGLLAKPTKLNANQYEKMKSASVNYLKTRVAKKNLIEGKVRKTRNSKRMREILDRFQGFYSADELDESVEVDFEVNNSKDVKEQINPYVLEIAKAELRVKEGNKEIFFEQCKGIDKEEYNEVAWRLTQERLLKPIWFKADPNTVINCWK